MTLPLGNHEFVFYICEAVYILHAHSFVLFIRLHI